MNFIRLKNTVETVLSRNSARSFWAQAFESIWYAYQASSAMAEEALTSCWSFVVWRKSFRWDCAVSPSCSSVIACCSWVQSNPRSNLWCYLQILSWKYFIGPAISVLFPSGRNLKNPAYRDCSETFYTVKWLHQLVIHDVIKDASKQSQMSK